jgi:hypothetical protein
MIYTHTETSRFANVALSGGPSPIGTWLKAAVLRLLRSSLRELPPRDRVQEAAEVRTLAASVRQTDPRFAADLFAAADHHEALAE